MIKEVLKFDPEIICATFDFVMRTEPTGEIHVVAFKLDWMFAENDRELWLEPT